MTHQTLSLEKYRKLFPATLKIRLLNHDMVLAYCSPFLIAISSANRLWYLNHSLPISPVVVKTEGVNVPCSMSRTLLYSTGAFSHSHAYDRSVAAAPL